MSEIRTLSHHAATEATDLREDSSYWQAERSILKQYYRVYGLPNQGWPVGQNGWVRLLDWMVNDLRFRIRPSTWRVYRNAIRRRMPAIQELQYLLDSPPIEAKHQLLKAGTKRQKGVDGRELSKIRHWLNQHAPRWGGTAALWLEAGALTGLRPGEWQECELITHDGILFLRVRTRKLGAGNKRLTRESKAPYRHVPLGHLSQMEIEAIRKQIHIVKRVLSFGMWDKYYRGCSDAIYRANRALFPNRAKTIALYSSRHEYAARIKTQLSEDTSGRLMGQSTSNTFKRSYGGKKNRKTPGISPHIEYKLLQTLNHLENEGD